MYPLYGDCVVRVPAGKEQERRATKSAVAARPTKKERAPHHTTPRWWSFLHPSVGSSPRAGEHDWPPMEHVIGRHVFLSDPLSPHTQSSRRESPLSDDASADPTAPPLHLLRVGRGREVESVTPRTLLSAVSCLCLRLPTVVPLWAHLSFLSPLRFLATSPSFSAFSLFSLSHLRHVTHKRKKAQTKNDRRQFEAQTGR